MERTVTLEPLQAKPWANIIRYKNCHEDLAPFLKSDGTRYTGLNKKDEKRLSEELRQELHPNSPYWDTFFIRVGSDPIVLNLDSAMDELKYLFLKNHMRVKNGLSENKATADYVLVDRDQEAKVQNTSARLKRKAFKEFDKMSSTDIRKALRLYGIKADSTSSEQAENKMFEFVEDNPQKFLDMWVNNKNKETQFLVEEAISKNVIRRNKNSYAYGTEVIGHSLEDTIAYLEDKKNQEIKQVIINEIDSKG